jgi:hypothetical protein
VLQEQLEEITTQTDDFRLHMAGVDTVPDVLADFHLGLLQFVLEGCHTPKTPLIPWREEKQDREERQDLLPPFQSQ